MSRSHVGACCVVLALAITSCRGLPAGIPPSVVAGAVSVQYTEDFEDDSGSGAGGFADAVFVHTATSGIVAEADFADVAPFPSPTHALRLALPQFLDTVAFSLNPGEFVDYAGVSANTFFGAATVEFIGTSDTLSFTFPQGDQAWQFAEAFSTDTGDLGQPLGEITAVNLTGFEGLFDDLTINVVGVPTGVDLDIARFAVSKRFSLAHGQTEINIKLVVKNNGLLDEAREATVVGMQNAVQVYSHTQAVSDPPGNGRTTHQLPPFTPTVVGDITWTATIADDDPDLDEATATTRVVE